jgi:hypothetical protein
MTTTTISAETAPVDVRMDAFSRPDGPEVFSAVTQVNQVWHPDPFDVESIHEEARETFGQLVQRATSVPDSGLGKSLLLLGEAGSGKTHLMRAFRNRLHADGRGYFAYMQMTTRQESYSRYVLSNLIDGLEYPYIQPHQPTGLDRLARALIDGLDEDLSDQARKIQDDELDRDSLAQLVHELADKAIAKPQFHGIDIDIIRAVVYLLCPDNRIRSRVVKWLRCEDLGRFDRDWIGDLVPRPQDHMPLRTIIDLGHLMFAVQDAALVICADQIEEMIDAAAVGSAAGEVFRRMIDALIEINTSVPTSIVVVSCLEDYYVKGRELLARPKLDRLEYDPAPIRLKASRSEGEIKEIVERRLEYLYGAFDLAIDPDRPTFPFPGEFLASLSGMSTRQVLNHCRQEQEYALAGKEVKFKPPVPGNGKVPSTGPENPLEQLWNDFHTSGPSPNLDQEPDLAKLLADAIASASAEISSTVHFSAECDGRMVPVEMHQPNNAVDKLLVAVCNRSAQGGGLKRQIDEVANRAGELSAVFVRSSPFPTSPKTVVMRRLAELITPKGKGRRVVIEAGDWKKMGAFQVFREKHGSHPAFAEWQRQQRPLTSLASLRDVLALDRLLAPSMPPMAPPTPAPQLSATPKPRAIQTAEPPVPIDTGSFRLGVTRSVTPAAVLVEPKELTQHAAFLGGSGSGKTTAALVMIEQLLLRGVAAVLIDRKGDLSRYADPDAWPGADSDSERSAVQRRLREQIDVVLYTPGNEGGRSLTLPIVPVDFAQLPAAERQQLAGYAAAALWGMMGNKRTLMDPRLAILGKAIEVLGTRGTVAVTVQALHQVIQDQDESLVAAVGNFDAKHYWKLSENLLTLKLQRQSLLEGDGESLDFDSLLGRGHHRAAGKTRLTIINTQFLGDTGAIDFWLSQFLLAAGRWAARNPAPDRLQAVLLFDEADQYLPATRQPATKGPMENLLRRARSAGIGLFLATQSPGDFDYKCRDQIRLWLIGRVKEPAAIAKLKPMLESARLDAAAKLPGQETGQFFLVREKEVVPILADRSLMSTQQLSEERIVYLAKHL